MEGKGGLVRRTDGRAPAMLKTDQPSSCVSYGEEYEKQRTRAGHLARESEGGGGGEERRNRTETGLLFERRRTLGLCTKWRIITDPKQTRYVSH